VALLMVSRFPYPHLTKQILRGKRSLQHIVLVIAAVLIMSVVRELAVVLVFWLYALGTPLWSLWRRTAASKPAPTLGDGPLPH
jgi:CDP-diacylglycerol---serine O-phosphatidyltransferase